MTCLRSNGLVLVATLWLALVLAIGIFAASAITMPLFFVAARFYVAELAERLHHGHPRDRR